MGGLKLTKEERYNAYLAVAEPDQRLQGLPIYALIDHLISKGDFETLTEVWMVGTDKKVYHSKVGNSISTKNSKDTQRKLRMGSSSNPDGVVEQAPNQNRLSRSLPKRTLSLE